MKSLKTLMYNGIKYFLPFVHNSLFLCFSCKSFKLLPLHMEVQLYRPATLEPRLPPSLSSPFPGRLTPEPR